MNKIILNSTCTDLVVPCLHFFRHHHHNIGRHEPSSSTMMVVKAINRTVMVRRIRPYAATAIMVTVVILCSMMMLTVILSSTNSSAEASSWTLSSSPLFGHGGPSSASSSYSLFSPHGNDKFDYDLDDDDNDGRDGETSFLFPSGLAFSNQNEPKKRVLMNGRNSDDGDGGKKSAKLPAFNRNGHRQKAILHHAKKTGTTIAGCVVRVPLSDTASGEKTTTATSTSPSTTASSEVLEYVVLAADTRATSGTMVADKSCSKIHPLASNCWCCGAGTSADLDKMTRQVLYSMALGKMIDNSIGNGPVVDTRENDGNSGGVNLGDEKKGLGHENDNDTSDDRSDCVLTATTSPNPAIVLYQEEYGNGYPILNLQPVSVDILCNFFQQELFKYQGQLGVNLILGCVWEGKAFLRAIHPHGSIDKNLPFTALGSGGLAAMAVLEEGYYKSHPVTGRDSSQSSSIAPCTSLKEGINLVQRAVLSGIKNDLGSGSQVDLCIIYPDGTSHHQRCSVPEEILEEMGKISKIPDAKVDDEEDEHGSGGGGRGDGRMKDFERRTIDGVNGFGNQPFAVESTKQRVVSIQVDEKQRSAEWDDFLGL